MLNADSGLQSLIFYGWNCGLRKGIFPPMLHTLRVRNLALVEDITVEFMAGLNVITGETGAGKSVIIGALGLLLGERADKSLIRAGAEQCMAEAVFHLSDAAAVDAVLDEVGLPACEDGQLLVRRSLLVNGTGKNFINDSATTLQVLKRVGVLLVDMHGPYDHQSLLNTDFQLDILDAFGHLWETRAGYETIYVSFRDLQSQRRELEGADEQEVAQQIELLSFQVKEIEDAAMVEGEDESLAREQVEVANAQRILELSEGVRNALMEGETSAFNGLAFAQKGLGELAALVEPAAGWRDEARSLTVQLQDLAETIEHHVRNIEGDPQRLQWLEDRMALYYRLKRKYGGTVKEVLVHLEKARTRLQALQSRGERLAEIDRQIDDVQAKLEQSGGKLGKARRQAASKLAGTITGELRDLGFPHGGFAVELAKAEPGPSGMVGIEFAFAPNAGEPARPLRAIASSGEISRVMLAVKAVLANHDSIPVLVFDEIDANVGGAMGTAIGTKLDTVGQHHQVLCITHLPQVAVHGSTHFAVAKEVVNGRTRTSITRLDDAERVEEIARMLGGRDLTSVTLKHAREMLRGK
jgi:DNA repair protein RecN (Recombination protein N)